MKRMIALLLALLLAMGCVAAGAEDYTLAQKLYRQTTESAFRGTVTFQVDGVREGAEWALLKMLAPKLTLEAEHSYYRGEGQATLRLLMDGQDAGTTSLIYNDELMGLRSGLLSDADAWYTAAKNWDATELLTTDSQWPPLWLALLRVAGASDEWKTRAATYLTAYETKLGVWLNGFAAVTAGEQDGVAYSELACQISPQAVKAQIKQMLVDFFGNDQLLSLLREVFSAEEAAAYLQPAMQSAFFTMIDSLQLSGNVEIIRRVDTTGKTLLDSITLPFGGQQRISGLTITSAAQDTATRWTATAQLSDGSQIALSCIQGEGLHFTGNISNLAAGADGAAESYDYALSVDPGQENYTLATDVTEQRFTASLTLTPQGDAANQPPAQSLTLEAVLSSGSSQRSATNLNATLTWTDLDNNASITARLNGKTASPWAVDSLDQVQGMRLDQLERDGRAALLSSWQTHLHDWFVALIAQQTDVAPATVEPGS